MKKQLRRITSAVLAVMLVLTSLLTLNVADVKAASGVLEASGHLESAYVEWAHISGATGYNVYVKSGSSSYTKLDNELVRQYPGYMRADAVGLAAGNYTMKIVPIISGSEDSSKALETGSLTVIGHDRTGFAFKNGKAFGAYNADGTLKSNAKVFYMTESTKGGFAAAVEAAADGNYPLAVRIIGKVTDFSGQDKGDMLIDGCENGLTIEGIGEDATAYGWGVRIKGSSDVEVRNIGLMWNDSTEGDGVGLQQDNTRIWVHNCDFFYGAPGSDADQVKGDGALDTKKSTYVTHSYNHFWDSGKCHLNGNSETNLNYITYHHNWYDHSDSRHPLIRVSSAVHIYNNLYDGVSKYGVIVRKGASAFVESNYFKDTTKPLLISQQGSDASDPISSDPGGIIKAYANKYDNTKAPITHKDSSTDFDCYEASSRTETVPSSYKCKKGGTSYSNFDTASSMYSYTAQSADAAKATVMKYAGRINGGDFKWDFSAASEDKNYDVISGLQSAIKSYKSKLLSIGGDKIVSDDTPAPEPTQSQEVTTQAPQETTKAPEATTQSQQQTTAKPQETTKPSGGGSTTGGTSYAHNFADSGLSSSFYTITGNTSTSKGSVTYNGSTLKTCLKMESATSIKFTAEKAGTLTLVFGGETNAAGKSVKVDGSSKTIGSDQILTIDLAAGSHTITKGDAIFLYYMVFEVEGEPHSHSYTATVTKAATCAEAGVKTYTCSCGHSYTEAIPATGAHSYTVTVTKAATCTTTGVKTYRCSCGASYTESIAALGHNYSNEWTIDKAATTTSTGEKSRHCTNCSARTDITVIPMVENLKNGLINENGTFYYYVDGAVATDYTGLVYSGSIWWYVENGVLNTSFTGPYTNSGGTWYIINGQLDSNYVGIRKNGSDFWYVVNGKVNTAFVGLYSYADYWWYITDGKIQTSYSGIVDYSGYKWFVSGGKVDTSYTGLRADNSGTFYCVQAGKVNLTYTGLVQSGGSWWYVVNGVLNTSTTGIVETGGSQWFVATGKLQSNYTGTQVYGGVRYTIVNGKVTATN